MVRKEKEEENQSYQLQLDFVFEDVVEGKRVETMPVETTLLQDFIKAEKNLEWLGFFTPSTSRGARKNVKEKVISVTTTVEGKKVRASATILPSAKYGLPDTADLDKYRAFQKLLSDELIRSGQVPKHITFTSADLLEAMGVSRQKKEGKAYAGRFHSRFGVVLSTVWCGSKHGLVWFYARFGVVLCTVWCGSMYGLVWFYVRFGVVLCTVWCGSMYGLVWFYVRVNPNFVRIYAGLRRFFSVSIIYIHNIIYNNNT